MSYQQIRIKGARLSPEDRIKVFARSQVSLYRPEGAIGLKYLVEERGLDLLTIADFGLGYVPLDVNHCFAGRIVMPIFDACSNLIALSVRPATTDKAIDDEYGKYWHETFEKGRFLYGMDIAKFWIAKYHFAIIVEGQMDTMSMHAWGMPNTVGILGGGFTPFHAMQLKRWTKNIVVLFDGDKAGAGHVKHCEEVLAYFDHTIKSSGFRSFGKQNCLNHVTMALPPGLDPSKYLREYGGSEMKKAISLSLTEKQIKVARWQ